MMPGVRACLFAVGLLPTRGHAEDCPALSLVQSRSQQLQTLTASFMSSKEDCSVLPTSMNGASKPRGCPGAVYQNDDPSYKYCVGMGNENSSIIYPWWAECCMWSAGTCVPKPPPQDCSVLPISMNGASKPKGCPGAVYQNDAPSYKYCAGMGNQDSSIMYPWWAECCMWSAGTCVPKPPPQDCSVLPISMNGASKPKGCPGAVYQNDDPAYNYCAGMGNQDSSIMYPWWAECCMWSAGACVPKRPPEFATIDFRYATLGQNNLGGLGPDTGPQVMVIKNVSQYGGTSLNLEIEALSDYAGNVDNNGLNGPFGQINVLNNNTVNLVLTLRNDTSGDIVHVPKFNFSFWDLDNGKKSGGVESITVGPILAHYTTSESEFSTSKISQSHWKFTATEFGKMTDNPSDLISLTSEQLNRALVVEASSPTLYVTLGVSMSTLHWDPEGGRTFLIGGASLNSGFSDHTLGEAPLKVALQADTGKYLARCRDCQNTVGAILDTATVHATSPQESYAQFTVMKLDGGKIALMSDNGKFAARCNGCIANVPYQDAVTFHVNDPNHLYAQFLPELQLNGATALKTDTGMYMARCNGCSPGAAYPDTATCHVSGPPVAHATWRVVPLTWSTGMKIALQGSNGNWISRCSGCQNTVNTNVDTGAVVATSPGPSYVHFTVVNVGGGKIALQSDNGMFAARCNKCVVDHKQEDTITFHVDQPLGDYAHFKPELLSNGKYALQTDTGKYVSRCNLCSPEASVDETLTAHANTPSEDYAQWSVVVLL